MAHLFKVDGIEWEKQSGTDAHAIHVEIGTKAHLCVWAYKGRSQYCVQRYVAGAYNEEKLQWLDAMETMCLVMEALKEAETELGLKSAKSKPI